MGAVITEPRRAGEFLVSEASGYRSRGQGMLLRDQVLAPGAILGRISHGAATAAAVAGNVGNGAIGAVTVGAGVFAGVYQAICIEPGTNAGKFIVVAPNGVQVGVATVGTAFSGDGLGFTISDGATDFASGDVFTVAVAVAAGSGKYRAWDPTNSDGSEVAVAILWAPTDATGADRRITTIERDAEVNAHRLVWFAGADAAAIATGTHQLAAVGIIVRE